MLVKPCDSLIEGLFLCELLLGVAQVATNRESMLGAAEEVDLPWVCALSEDGLRLLAQLNGEDLVCLGSADAVGTLDVLQFLLCDE